MTLIRIEHFHQGRSDIIFGSYSVFAINKHLIEMRQDYVDKLINSDICDVSYMVRQKFHRQCSRMRQLILHTK